MHRSILCSTLGLTLSLAACGEDPATTESAGATESAGTTSENPTSSSTTLAPTGGQTGTEPDGTMSDSLSGTTTTGPDPSTGPDTGGSTQSIEETGESTAGETGDDTTGGESTAGESTVGESTGGESSGGEETGDPLDCPLVAQHVPCDLESDDPMHAFGLNCTSLGGDYVDNVNAVTISNFDFQYPDPMFGEQTWQVARSYGTFIDPNTNQPFWSPREGDKLLMISSGLLPPADGQGAVIVEDCDVFNDSYVGPNFFDDPPFDDNIMPPPMSPNNGSPDPMGYTNCDGVGDCSNTMSAQWQLGMGNAEDKMWFGFELTAPAIANGDMVDAKGYTFDFAYFSAEFPEYVDSQFNDIFIVWQASEDYTGNVTFINEQPLTVTALWPIDYQGECDFDNDPNCNLEADEHLLDTGHQGCGGATGWYKATGGIKPGETFTLTFGIFDMGDSSFDTTALLDNWQWDCEGCVPNEVMSCGVDPQ